ncbi:hypothetical protein MMC18_001862 [Xylographa bjoerkii]|nr:hypothetical protein [Xylographa bjoerkii]
MQSSFQAEAQLFHGKSVTPESPRPLHIPEPSTIPVLQNQIDPIFNLMSTHMKHPNAARDITTMDHEMALKTATAGEAEAIDTNDRIENDVDYDAKLEDFYGDTRSSEGDSVSMDMNGVKAEHNQSDSSLIQNHTSLQADQPSTSIAFHDTPPTTTQPNVEYVPSSHSHSNVSPQHLTDTYEPFHTPSNVDSQTYRQTSGPRAYETDETNIKIGGQGDETVENGGVNYQTLLDNISPSSASESLAIDPSISQFELPTETTDIPIPSSANLPITNVPAPAGLPPRPPPQEKPAIHPNYVPGEDIRSYHFPHVHHAGTHTSLPSQPSNSYRPVPGYVSALPISASGAPGTSSAHNGLPPPPMATFQQPPRAGDQPHASPTTQQFQRDMAGSSGTKAGAPADTGDRGGRWAPEVERMYDEFISDERVYTAEGTWDRFPPGSRLFVGNLPSEIVNKRDIFQIFYKYGKLAQISIKQAYGFVQFLDPNACRAALENEQGMRIKDRNMHLEISKPQKNSRNAAASAAGDNLRASHYRRSRSPDHIRRQQSHGVGPRPGADRFVPFSDFRDEPRRRDDYRPGRSPSPRGYRGRDEYRGGRDRSPDRYYGRRSRSRSPFGRAPRYRSPSPRAREVDQEATLPIPRRDARDVPDVQLILIEEVDRAFVTYIESSFRERGLRCAVLILPGVPLEAVVKRQILEGVQAIVKLYRTSQLTGKIPLQLFDRTGGADNVRFEEYDELEARIAAELVIRAKAKQITAAVPTPHNLYTAPSAPYSALPYTQAPQAPLPQQAVPNAGQPNIANLITSLDGPALQKLLGAMQQNPQTPQTPQQHMPLQSPAQNQDLSALLGNVGMQQQQQHHPPHNQQSYPYAMVPQQQQQQQPVQQYQYGASYQQAPQQAGPPQHQQPQPGQHQHVQDIMEQLAKWKQ